MNHPESLFLQIEAIETEIQSYIDNPDTYCAYKVAKLNNRRQDLIDELSDVLEMQA